MFVRTSWTQKKKSKDLSGEKKKKKILLHYSYHTTEIWF